MIKGLKSQEHFLLVENETGEDPETAAPQVHGQYLSVTLCEGFPRPGEHPGHDLVTHVHQYRVHPREYEGGARPESKDIHLPTIREHEGQDYLYTSMRMYIPDKSRNAMLPVAMTNDTDQRFLLMGMTPVF